MRMLQLQQVPQSIENPGQYCRSCMPWTLPFALKARPSQMRTGDMIPMTFDEWLLYHLHVVLHQRGVPLS